LFVRADGGTALIWASCEGHLSVVHVLFAAGANINQDDAKSHSHIDIGVVLLEYFHGYTLTSIHYILLLITYFGIGMTCSANDYVIISELY
jgi:ankyrin repeat protein